MKVVTGSILSSIFFLLSTLHFYWAAGGNWASDIVLPKDLTGNAVLQPTTIDTIIVGSVLMVFAFYYLVKADLLRISLPRWILNSGYWLISGIFLLRAFGDFNYVGFTKRIKHTDFATLDSRYFSPLCLLIACSSLLLWYADRRKRTVGEV
jgi:hypothetical protein